MNWNKAIMACALVWGCLPQAFAQTVSLQYVAPKDLLIDLTLGISADMPGEEAGGWPRFQSTYRNAVIDVTPSGGIQPQDVTLILVNGDSKRNISNLGQLVRHPRNPSQWLYSAFPEDPADLNPPGRTVISVVALCRDPLHPDGRSCATKPLQLHVRSVFQYLVRSIPLLDSPSAGVSEVEIRRQVNEAKKFVLWKYRQALKPGKTPVGFDLSRSIGSKTNVRKTRITLDRGAFASENKLASTIGHEMVHINQAARWIGAASTTGQGADEMEAYSWELGFQVLLGTSKEYADCVQERIAYYGSATWYNTYAKSEPLCDPTR